MTRFGERVRRGVVGMVVAVLAAGALVLIPAGTALAHCDSVNGPVVAAAREALARGEVKLILPYIKAQDEGELEAAFHETRAAMKQGGKAAELAERWFWETAVRLHRQGEGASYTGLKYDAGFSEALHAAEEAVETGDLDHVAAVLNEAIRKQLEAKYHEILETRERAEHEDTVAASRAAVEAVLVFELYVDALDEAIKGHDPHGEPGAVSGHEAIAVLFNGQPLSAKALREGEKLMLPLRAVAEAVGAAVRWDDHDRAVLVEAGAIRFTVRPGADGAVLYEGATMVPAHFLVEKLGLGHELHGETLLLTH